MLENSGNKNEQEKQKDKRITLRAWQSFQRTNFVHSTTLSCG